MVRRTKLIIDTATAARSRLTASMFVVLFALGALLVAVIYMDFTSPHVSGFNEGVATVATFFYLLKLGGLIHSRRGRVLRGLETLLLLVAQAIYLAVVYIDQESGSVGNTAQVGPTILAAILLYLTQEKFVLE